MVNKSIYFLHSFGKVQPFQIKVFLFIATVTIAVSEKSVQKYKRLSNITEHICEGTALSKKNIYYDLTGRK